MLRFAVRPDKAFNEIVTECLALALDLLKDEHQTDDEATSCFDQCLGAMFSRSELAREVERLSEARNAKVLHMPTEYHWLILADILTTGIELHNQAVDEFGPRIVGSVLLGRIDFEAVADIYFWDEDFLIDAEAFNAMGAETKRQMQFSDGAFAVVNRMKPHPADLEMTVWSTDGWKPEKGLYRKGRSYPQCREA
jgi:hypothetical protein